MAYNFGHCLQQTEPIWRHTTKGVNKQIACEQNTHTCLQESLIRKFYLPIYYHDNTSL